MLPLLLSVRLRYAVGVLVWCWVVPGVYAIIRDPSVHTIVDLGYDTASVLVAQLCALVVADMIRRSAAAASAETESHMRLIAAAHIADAVQEEYDRRYADLAATIQPLLSGLADGAPVDAETRSRAQLEYQRLRTLFDQSSSFEHVLLRELRPRVDAAQNRGIAVSVDVQGTLPALDVPTARRLAPKGPDLPPGAHDRDHAGKSLHSRLIGQGLVLECEAEAGGAMRHRCDVPLASHVVQNLWRERPVIHRGAHRWVPFFA